MSRFWRVSPADATFSGASAPGWVCQLVHAEFGPASADFDLVALEPRPGAATSYPRHTPFTMHVEMAEDSDPRWAPALSAWSDSADVITITTGETAGSTWLCLSAGDEHVVVELTNTPGHESDW